METFSSLKKEKEIEQKINHSSMVKNYLSSHRNQTSSLKKNQNSGIRYRYKKYSLSSEKKNSFSEDILSIIDEIKSNLIEIKADIKFSYDKKWKITEEIKEKIKILRKELSNENIPKNKIKNILEHDIQNFIELLIELIENISDDYLLLEILWILNNIIFFSAKYNVINLDSIKISNQISKLYLTQVKNINQFRYSLLEKMHRILGNLLFINSKSIYSLINNNIITNIIECLIRPVSSFRKAGLWLLNKILKALKENNDVNNYINLFINKYSIYNYNFIFLRINTIELDEMAEFFWLLTELSKYNSTLLINIFFNGFQYKNNYEKIIKNFEFILNNCMTNNLSQISFRLISNLLVICYNELNNEYLITKFIENFFEKKSVLYYINDILTSPFNQFDISFVKDVLLLIFNLLCISAIKTGIFFKKGIVNLISDKDYYNNKDIIKLLFMIFYKILISNSFSFEPNDENVIKVILILNKKFKYDENILILFIDILFFYLQFTNTIIYEELKNEIDFIKKEKNTKLENYQNIFEKLSNLVLKASPLAKFLN